MKKALAALPLVLCCASTAEARPHGTRVPRSVPVRGHTTKKGTYVPPHHRTAPDGTRKDNWSQSPNVNPYTGKPGEGKK